MRDSAGPWRAAITGTVTAALLACGLLSCGRSETSPVPDEEAMAAGRALYERYGCGTCHGREGRGDGPVSPHLDPRPRDFRDVESFRNGRSVVQVARTIRQGIMVRGSGMPGYPHLEERERVLLARYVVAFGAERE